MDKEEKLMTIWRLIAHHYNATEAIKLMRETNRLAIGWSKIGNLEGKSKDDISKLICEGYPELNNSRTGAPSLYHFYKNIEIGDWVIVNEYRRKHSVFEITGKYEFVSEENSLLGYQHQRSAVPIDVNAEQLWQSVKNIVPGENKRWTLMKCSLTKETEAIIHEEGARHTITSTMIERNSDARKVCLAIHGYKCKICSFDFKEQYGELGDKFIHVHHIEDISLKKEVYNIDPEKELIPVCPNCHAMLHKKKPSLKPDELKKLLKK